MNKQAVVFASVLQKHRLYFYYMMTRRLFLLQNKEDFFEEVEENLTNFHKRDYGTLGKVFWEIEPNFLELIYSDKFIKDWNKL